MGLLFATALTACNGPASGAAPASVVHTDSSGRGYVTNKSGHVYVTNQLDNTVSVIDVLHNKVVATVPAGAAPDGVAVTQDGSHVYIADNGSAEVSVLDTGTNEIVATAALCVADGTALGAGVVCKLGVADRHPGAHPFRWQHRCPLMSREARPRLPGLAPGLTN
jgi:YVTN family beta-propeller protein